MIIALDGPAAAGKGTLGRRLAETHNLAYLDTGLLYRAVGAAVLDRCGTPSDPVDAVPAAEALSADELSRTDLRTEHVGSAASAVAAIEPVRTALLAFQKQFAHAPGKGFAGSILDGRDIGTVICPEADVKLFITASAEVRAARRAKELRERGEVVIEADVLAALKARDTQDQERAAAPLKPADDAFVIDTSALDADQVFLAAQDHIASVMS